MEYTILILLLPFLSFLALGIGGKWMSHRTAGTIGTLVLAAVTVLWQTERLPHSFLITLNGFRSRKH